jgi:DNA-binding beta-propeller fold protein YncE
VQAFVHVLSLAEGWAYCVDLPLPFGMGPASAHALALSPDGRRLYTVDRSTGTLAVVDTESLQLLQTAPKEVLVDPTPRAGAVAAVQVRRGTLFLGGGSEVISLDATTLAPEQRWAVSGLITGLGMSPDANRLYVGLADRAVVLDAASGRELGAVAAPGLAGIQYVGRAPAQRT